MGRRKFGFNPDYNKSSREQFFNPTPGNIILAIPNYDRSFILLEHLRMFADRDLGCQYIATLQESLANLHVNHSDYAKLLRYIFVLLRTSYGDEISAINRILRFYCCKSLWDYTPIPSVEIAELNHSLNFYSEEQREFTVANGIGLPFDLRAANSKHEDYLKMLNVRDAQNRGFKGSNVKITVVDSGIDSSCTFVNTFADFKEKMSNKIDRNGHGTAMASIIHDVAPEAEICSIRVADQSPDLWTVMIGICKAVFDYESDIVNLSLGFSSLGKKCIVCDTSNPAKSEVFREFISSMLASSYQIKPAIYVTATGNDGKNSFNEPAAYDHVLAVGAINGSLQRSKFSNYGYNGGYKNFIVMPGGDIDLGNKREIEWVGEGVNAKCCGTSPATAYATGILALYYSCDSYVDMAVEEFLGLVLRNARPVTEHNILEHGIGYLPFVLPK